MLTQEDAQGFSKFGADNKYFQKIFSELFLGGEGSHKEEGEEHKLEGTAQKIIDDISCLALEQESEIMEKANSEEPYPSSLSGC